jgi:hypothetical protein
MNRMKGIAMTVMEKGNSGPIELVPPMACDRCAGSLRLVGIEPHHTLAATDVFTYICTKCDTTHVLAVPQNSSETLRRR